MKALLNKLFQEYNIDKDNVVIMGHSLGANNAMYFAEKMPDYFSKAVICSGGAIDSYKPVIPTIWYFGTNEVGYYITAANKIENMEDYGEDAVCWLSGAGHQTPEPAYNKDDGRYGIANNNRSDLIEWMFEDCTLKKDSRTVEFFDSDITFSWKSFKNNPDGLVDYGLCIPSNANEYEKIPLIVWLHGWFNESNHYNLDVDKISTKTTGIPYAVLGGSNLEKFSAYILCPKYPGNKVEGWWEPNQIKQLVDKMIKEYNVDKDNIVIIGHSFGGGNVPRVVNGMPGYFSKAVICSGYDSTLLSIPTQCYVGTDDSDSGKQWGASIENKIAATNDKNTSLCRIVSNHGTPIRAYKIDDGKFGRYSE